MAFDRTHPVTQLLCRREPVLTRKFKSLSQKTVASIADCDTFYLDDTRKAMFQNQNLSRVPWKTKSAKGKLVLVSCFCVHMYKKRVFWIKMQKQYDLQQAWALPLRCMHEISSLITSLFLCPVTPGRDQTCTTWKHLWSALICFYPFSRVLVAVPEWRSVPAAQHLLLSWRLDGSTLWRA